MKKKPVTPPAKERLVATAARLFEAQGYESTGINQIITESETAKASFYDHFASKELLGQEYLARYGRKHLELLAQLMQRSATPQEFIAAWVRLIKRQNRSGVFYGCPMANLRAQIGIGSPVLASAIATLAADTLFVAFSVGEDALIVLATGRELPVRALRVGVPRAELIGKLRNLLEG